MGLFLFGKGFCHAQVGVLPLEKVQSIEMIISGLVNCGWGYDDIKNFITNPAKQLLAA